MKRCFCVPWKEEAMGKLVHRSLLVLVFLLVLQLVVGSTVVLADPGYHLVRAGDTLSSIGRLYGVNPYAIAAANGLANPNYIYVGQLLFIPEDGSTAPASPPQYYHPRYWHGQNYWYRQNCWYVQRYWYRPTYGWYQPHAGYRYPGQWWHGGYWGP
jgi:hypothetical protein